MKRWILMACLLGALGTAEAAEPVGLWPSAGGRIPASGGPGSAPRTAHCTATPNIFGGQEVRCSDGTRLSSRPNIHGGYDYSDGTRSRANIFGGYDITTPAERKTTTPAAAYDPGKRLR